MMRAVTHGSPSGGAIRAYSIDRRAIEDAIERLIALLDAMDAPDEDREPEDDQCQAGDDGCGFVRLGDVSGWGSLAFDA